MMSRTLTNDATPATEATATEATATEATATEAKRKLGPIEEEEPEEGATTDPKAGGMPGGGGLGCPPITKLDHIDKAVKKRRRETESGGGKVQFGPLSPATSKD